MTIMWKVSFFFINSIFVKFFFNKKGMSLISLFYINIVDSKIEAPKPKKKKKKRI